MPSRTRLRDEHARRARGDEHELVAAGPRDRVHEPDASRRAPPRPGAATWSPARAPAASLSSREAVDVEQRDRDLGCPGAGPGRPRARGRGRASARSTARSAGRCATRARATRRARRPSTRCGTSRSRRPRDPRPRPAASPRSCSTSCSPAQPNVSTPTHASTPPLRDDERQVRAGHRRAVRRRPRRGRATRSGRAPRGGSGGPGSRRRRLATPSTLVVRHPEGEQQLEARRRSRSWAKTAAIGAPTAAAPASTITASAWSRSFARASAAAPADSTAERAGAGVGPCPPRVPPRAVCAGAGRPDPPAIPSRRVRASRHRTPRAARRDPGLARGRRLCSAR